MQRIPMIPNRLLLAPLILLIALCAIINKAFPIRDLTRDPSQFYVQEEIQTFLDNVVIHSHRNVTRRWYRPSYHNDVPVIKKDRPWEHITYFTYSNYCVLRDPQDGLFKCWYEDLHVFPEQQKTKSSTPTYSRQLYAESDDGINWRKPEFDFVRENGRKTNIVLGSGAGGGHNVHSMTVVIDPYPPSPNHRFRALLTHRTPEHPGHTKTVACAHSPDGIHWQLYEQAPVIGRSGPRLDDVSVSFYDHDAREFVQNTRHFLKGPGGGGAPRGGIHQFASDSRRRVWQCRSHDFIHWSEPILVAAVDEEDGLDEQFYGMAQYKLGTIYLATVGVFRHVDNEMDVQLLMSRDGLRWKQTAKRRPFMAPRGEGHFDAHMVGLVSPPIEVGDELRFYVGGAACHHDWWLWGPRDALDHPEAKDLSLAKFSLGLATLRKDGYASLYANQYREGVVMTQSMMSSGTKLIINARCGNEGSIRVEVTDPFDQTIEPCSKEHCDVFTGDSVSHTVTWKEDPTIPVRSWRRLRFYLRDAELFSFHFAGSQRE